MKKIFPERFKGQVIVLTGAARGIGKATALRAAREGARLVLTDRLEKEGSEVLKAVTEEGGEAIFLCLDRSAALCSIGYGNNSRSADWPGLAGHPEE